jgi:aspartyl-tRNA(Asn)/glutamyl-tRNA(Gln) amidotransferase subunit C
MAKLKRSEVLKIAKLAKLKLKSTEVKKFRNQLTSVIDYIDQLKEINTSNIAPTSQTTGLTNSLRKDKKGSYKGLSQKQALSGTENTHNGYFVVPAVLEKEL